MTDPLPEISRVRGGGSARIGAVILSIALVAVVWIGISGQKSPGPVSAVPTALPSTTKSAGSDFSNASPVPAATVKPSATPAPPKSYGASLSIGSIRYATIMSELSPGHLSAELHFPSPPRLPVGTLEFRELWKYDNVDAAIEIGTWTIDLDALAAATRTPANVLDESVPAQREAKDAPPPVRAGYRITAVGSNDLLFSRLTIEVLSEVPPDGAHPTSEARLGVAADSGNAHRAVILTPGENGSFTGSFTLPKPRQATTAHLLLYDVQMTISHDIWTEIADMTFELRPEQSRVGTSKLIVDHSAQGIRVVARTSGNVRGQSITVTVIARTTQAEDQRQ